MRTSFQREKEKLRAREKAAASRDFKHLGSGVVIKQSAKGRKAA